MKKSIAILILFLAPTASALSLQCKLGTVRCIKSQDTEIPSKQVVKLLDRCHDFTDGDLGRAALRMTNQQVADHHRKHGVTPLLRAFGAFDDIYDSPLAFDRKSDSVDVRYFGIKKSCAALERDFNDESKWTK